MDNRAALDAIVEELPKLRWAQIDLCRAAGVTRQTWWRARNYPDQISPRNLRALEEAVAKRRSELPTA